MLCKRNMTGIGKHYKKGVMLYKNAQNQNFIVKNVTGINAKMWKVTFVKNYCNGVWSVLCNFL